MSQNRSSAVMSQRHEPHDSLDDYPTPPWATRGLIEHVLYRLDPFEFLRAQTAWDPCANRGFMVRPMTEYFARVHASDVHDYGAGLANFRLADFLMHGSEGDEIERDGIDWIFMNPPFRLAAQFIHRARAVKPRRGVVCLVRTAFVEGVERYNTLYAVSPPNIIAHYAERVPMVRGRYDPAASSATAYSWLVFLADCDSGEAETRTWWIPPCRKQLERVGDSDGFLLAVTAAPDDRAGEGLL